MARSPHDDGPSLGILLVWVGAGAFLALVWLAVIYALAHAWD